MKRKRTWKVEKCVQRASAYCTRHIAQCIKSDSTITATKPEQKAIPKKRMKKQIRANKDE